MTELLKDFGAGISWNKKNKTIQINARSISKKTASYELVSKMRASFLVMGPFLSRFGEVSIPLPGGCQIGARPVDLHLKGLAALGARITQEHGYVEAKAKKLTGAKIYLDFPSVGATENIMMAAILAEGQSIIENCAVEPEVVDLANFLNRMGADIRGAGTDTIRVNGVKNLNSVDYTVIPDRIEAGTFLVAGAITRGDVTIKNVVADHLRPIIAKLREINISVEENESDVRVFYDPVKNLATSDIKTLPYPGFPTDMQAQFMSLLTTVKGSSIVTETVFENRFMHVGELKRMGADIKIDSRSAIIEGGQNLMGAKVKASDLRAGAALVLAALCAEGETEIEGVCHIKRGYFEFDEKLKSLGARIGAVSD
jgi:UDP-N-acetylglucosamine 1-carboxyvinyltransferase